VSINGAYERYEYMHSALRYILSRARGYWTYKCTNGVYQIYTGVSSVCIGYSSVPMVRYDISSLALECIVYISVPTVCIRPMGVSSVCIGYSSVSMVRYDMSSLALECIAYISVCMRYV